MCVWHDVLRFNIMVEPAAVRKERTNEWPFWMMFVKDTHPLDLLAVVRAGGGQQGGGTGGEGPGGGVKGGVFFFFFSFFWVLPPFLGGGWSGITTGYQHLFILNHTNVFPTSTYPMSYNVIPLDILLNPSMYLTYHITTKGFDCLIYRNCTSYLPRYMYLVPK
jgi:hypothetical protein